MAFLGFFSVNPMFTVASLTLLLLYILEVMHFRQRLAIASNLKIERRVRPAQIFVDEKVAVTLLIKNKRKWGLDTVRISDEIPETLAVETGSVSTIVKVPGGEAAQIDYVARALQMGDHVFKTVKVEIVDFLGLFQGRATIRLNSSIEVYPRVRTLSLIRAHAPKTEVYAAVVGERTLNVPGRGSEFHGIRDYSSADDFKNIYWKAVARSPNHNLMTKEFEADKSLDIIVGLQCAPTLVEGAIGARKLDVVVEAILSLSNIAVREGDRLTFLFRGERQRIALPRRARHSQIFQATKSLYNLQLGGIEDVGNVLSKLAREASRGSIMFLISDQPAPDLIPLELLRELGVKSSRAHFLLLRTSSFLPVPKRVTWQAREGYEYLLNQEDRYLAAISALCKTVDVEATVCGPTSLASRMVDTYLRAKRRGVIAA